MNLPPSIPPRITAGQPTPRLSRRVLGRAVPYSAGDPSSPGTLIVPYNTSRLTRKGTLVYYDQSLASLIRPNLRPGHHCALCTIIYRASWDPPGPGSARP